MAGRKTNYYMTEPYHRGEGVWTWNVRYGGPSEVIESIEGVDFVINFRDNGGGTGFLVHTDPRYDYEEVWLEMDAALKLDCMWGDAVDALPTPQPPTTEPPLITKIGGGFFDPGVAFYAASSIPASSAYSGRYSARIAAASAIIL